MLRVGVFPFPADDSVVAALHGRDAHATHGRDARATIYCFGGATERTTAPLSGLTTRIENRSTLFSSSVFSEA